MTYDERAISAPTSRCVACGTVYTYPPMHYCASCRCGHIFDSHDQEFGCLVLTCGCANYRTQTATTTPTGDDVAAEPGGSVSPPRQRSRRATPTPN